MRGITTAATIWASAAIGMAIGRELYLVAGLGTVLIFIVLEARPVTRRVDQVIRRRTREPSEEPERDIASSDMNDRERGEERDE